MRGVVMLAVLVATAAGAAEAEAPEGAARKTFLGLSVLPSSSPRGALGVEVEHAVGERVSVRLGARVGTHWNTQDFQGQVTHNRDFALGAEPGVRFYLTGRAPSGLWVGPNLELYRAWSTYEFPSRTVDGTAVTIESHIRQWSVGASGLVGYSMVLREGLTVQAGVGFGVSRGWLRNEGTGLLLGGLDGEKHAQQVLATQEYRSTTWAFGERVSFAVGWAF